MTDKGDGGRPHRFGGSWTEVKLQAIREYLQRYTTALKSTPFRKTYIDAFAGTGSRQPKPKDPNQLVLPTIEQKEVEDLLDGSVRIALKTDPPFDEFLFIDADPDHCAQLEVLKKEFPDHEIEIKQGDANELIKTYCKKRWGQHRAVLFLDPYGMQVEWSTIEAIAATQAIDMWLLFPLGIGVNRMLTRSGKINPSWKKRLNTLFGTNDWYGEFYKEKKTERTLFDTEESRVEKERMGAVRDYFLKRLDEVFAGVVREPGELRGPSNSLMYLLFFAAGNPKGAPIATRIAGHIMRRLN